MEDFEKVALLENEIEAQILDTILSERDIPHIVQSDYDDAFDGLFQTTKGWGHVLAPPSRQEEIIEILKELRGEEPASEALDP